MKLIKVTCEIRFLKKMKVLGPYENLYKKFLGKDLKNIEKWAVPGLRLEDKERKRIMVVDGQRTIVDIEQPPNVGYCKDIIIQFQRSVESELGFPEISRWGIRSTWIREYGGEFKDLLEEYKSVMYGGAGLVKDADDVAAVLDYYLDDGIKLSVTTGPMELKQLSEQYMTFEMEWKPPLFMYADVDVGDRKTNKYSEKYLAQFIERGIQEGERLSSQVADKIGGSK